MRKIGRYSSELNCGGGQNPFSVANESPWNLPHLMEVQHHSATRLNHAFDVAFRSHLPIVHNMNILRGKKNGDLRQRFKFKYESNSFLITSCIFITAFFCSVLYYMYYRGKKFVTYFLLRHLVIFWQSVDIFFVLLRYTTIQILHQTLKRPQ